MNSENLERIAQITQWLERATEALPDEECPAFLIHVFETLMRRAEPKLGSVALTAMVERALYVGSQRFPILAATTTVGPEGLSINENVYNASSGRGRDLIQPIGFVLSEIYSLVDRLTGSLLTPALYSELAQILESKSPEKS